MTADGPRRILAVVALDAGGAAVARRAWAEACRHGARFALAHVADWGAGLDDGYSPLTPAEVESRLAVVVSRKLDAMAAEIGAAGRTATLVGFARPNAGLDEIARGWQPDLIVASTKDELVVDGHVHLPEWSCDGLAVEPPPLRLWGKAARRVRSALAPRRPALR